MMKKKGKGTRMRPLSLVMVLMAMLFGLALFMPGEEAYASQQQQQQQQGQAPYARDEAKIQVLKLDQDDAPVVGAKMALYRIKIPDAANPYLGSADYNALAAEEKYTGKVKEWTTGETPEVIDLSDYYPESYAGKTYNQNMYYEEGHYPFCYMLIETETPAGYMTAEKRFFRVDPYLWSYSPGDLGYYNIKYYNADPRKADNNARTASSTYATAMITAVDTEAPLLVDKLDQNGKHLKGAELELLDDKGNPVMGIDGKPVKWISSGGTDELKIKRPSFPDADATEHGGGPVKYTIREISAPEGYEKSKDVTFTLYPCGKWDYMKGSEPAIGHKPGEAPATTKQGSSCSDGMQEFQVTPNNTGPVIPYVYTDPIRVIDFKVNKENGVSKGDFTINKTDQDRQPLSEVAFAVYGKPKLTTTIDVDVTKHWEYEGATTVTGSIGPDEHALTEEPEPQEQHVEQQQPEDGDGSQGQQEAQVPEVNLGPALLKREGNEKSFPYDYMANLSPKVTIKDGTKEIGTMTGTPLKDILGDAFDKAQNNGEKTAGTYLSYTDSYYGKTTVQGIPHWYYQGSADEKLGTVTLKDGDVVVISEEMEGSLLGAEAKVERTYTIDDPDVPPEYRTYKRVFVNDTVNPGGVGKLVGDSSVNLDKYNKYDRPIPTNMLRHFSDYYTRSVVAGNLVRHIAPQPVVLEFKNGKLMMTDEKGTHDITDSRKVVVTNIVQWRTEANPVIQPPPVVCPPKWK